MTKRVLIGTGGALAVLLCPVIVYVAEMFIPEAPITQAVVTMTAAFVAILGGGAFISTVAD